MKTEGEVFAINDICSHANVSLSEGEVEDCQYRALAARLRVRPAHRQAVRPSRDVPRPRIPRKDRRGRRTRLPHPGVLRNPWQRLKSTTCTSPSRLDNATKEILKGVDLTVKQGETHAIMGPNGSGKSTLAYSLAGHPKYTITSGTVTLDGENVLEMSVDERARAGLFLAMQYPVEIPGVLGLQLPAHLRHGRPRRGPQAAHLGEGRSGRPWSASTDPSFAERNVNEGVLRR